MDLFFRGQQLDGTMLKHLVPPATGEKEGFFVINYDQLFYSPKSETKTSTDDKLIKIEKFDGRLIIENDFYFPTANHSGIYNGNFVTKYFLNLSFKNGRLMERSLEKRFLNYKDLIQFGKYRDTPYSALLHRQPRNPSVILHNLFSFLINKTISKCDIPWESINKLEMLEKKLLDLDEVSLDGHFDKLKTAKSLKLLTGNNSFLIYDKHLGDNFYGMVEEFIDILESNFINLVTFENDKVNLEIDTYTSVFPDFKYISWAIENVENFCVLPSYFEESISLFERFEVKNVKDNLYEYTPKFEVYNVADKFQKEIIEKNFRKFCSLENVKFNSSLNYYEVDDTTKDDFLLFWLHDKDNNYYGDDDESYYDGYDDTPKFYNNPWLACLPPDEASEAFSNTD